MVTSPDSSSSDKFPVGESAKGSADLSEATLEVGSSVNSDDEDDVPVQTIKWVQ